GDHRRGAVSSWRLGRYVHAGSTHRVALPPGWADALLFVRRRPHLLQGREAPSAEPGRYGQYPAGDDALARRFARSPVLASGAVGSRRAGSRHRLGHARQRRRVQRGGELGLNHAERLFFGEDRRLPCRTTCVGPRTAGLTASVWPMLAGSQVLNPSTATFLLL